MIVEVCRFEHGDEKAWDEYVYSHPEAGHCHLNGWRRVVEKSYGHRPLYLWAHKNGNIKGILPLILIRSRLFGRSLASLPFLDDGGICADNDQVRDELFKKALQLFKDCRADYLDLRHRRPNNLSISSIGSKVTLTLKLQADPDRMWKRFDAKLRNQVRKSMKSHLEVSWAGIEGLTHFYEVFSRNMRDLGSPVHSEDFFRAILEEFPESARIILVRKGKLTVGAALSLFFKDTIQIPWASSRREYFSLCPNILLYWEAIRCGCEQGFKRFDFGRSSVGSGTYRFKKQWGTIDEPLYWQCISRNGQRMTMVQSDDPHYQWASRAWKRLPLTITNLIGPVLRRQMSN